MELFRGKIVTSFISVMLSLLLCIFGGYPFLYPLMQSIFFRISKSAGSRSMLIKHENQFQVNYFCLQLHRPKVTKPWFYFGGYRAMDIDKFGLLSVT